MAVSAAGSSNDAIEIAERWFSNELSTREKQPVGRMTTMLTDKYKINWTACHAVREIVQNFFDGIVATFGLSSKDDVTIAEATVLHEKARSEASKIPSVDPDRFGFVQGWDAFVRSPRQPKLYVGTIAFLAAAPDASKRFFVHQEKCVLGRKHLLFRSDKPTGSAGGFGEGFKIGALVLAKLSVDVSYHMRDQDWTFGLDHEGTYFVDCAENADASAKDSMQVVVGSGCSLGKNPQSSSMRLEAIRTGLPRMFVALAPKRSFAGKIRCGTKGTIFALAADADMAGEIYVGGISVQQSIVFRELGFAADMSSAEFTVNRDRSGVTAVNFERTLVQEALKQPLSRDRLLSKVLACCAREGMKSLADAKGTAQLVARGMKKPIEDALGAKYGQKVYLRSNGIRAPHARIVSKLGYRLVKSGWLESSKRFDEILGEYMHANVLTSSQVSVELPERSQDNIKRIQAVFDTFAHITAKDRFQVKAWKPPPRLRNFYDSMHVYPALKIAYVPATRVLSVTARKDLLFGVVQPAIKRAYDDVRTVLDVMRYFAREDRMDVPPAEVLAEFRRVEQTTVDDALEGNEADEAEIEFVEFEPFSDDDDDDGDERRKRQRTDAANNNNAGKKADACVQAQLFVPMTVATTAVADVQVDETDFDDDEHGRIRDILRKLVDAMKSKPTQSEIDAVCPNAVVFPVGSDVECVVDGSEDVKVGDMLQAVKSFQERVRCDDSVRMYYSPKDARLSLGDGAMRVYVNVAAAAGLQNDVASDRIRKAVLHHLTSSVLRSSVKTELKRSISGLAASGSRLCRFLSLVVDEVSSSQSSSSSAQWKKNSERSVMTQLLRLVLKKGMPTKPTLPTPPAATAATSSGQIIAHDGGDGGIDWDEAVLDTESYSEW